MRWDAFKTVWCYTGVFAGTEARAQLVPRKDHDIIENYRTVARVCGADIGNKVSIVSKQVDVRIDDE